MSTGFKLHIILNECLINYNFDVSKYVRNEKGNKVKCYSKTNATCVSLDFRSSFVCCFVMKHKDLDMNLKKMKTETVLHKFNN